ncbi:MAG TPA: MotA/TolQ/ExbB proton channel family protein [Elusimicrobiales bacterium]|nr:MotA/TolQ/ExbB proton channel family protein [Elusimicrobiales bacterium]
MDLGIRELISAGGPVLFLLVGISIYSISLMLERWSYYKRHVSKANKLLRSIRVLLKANEVEKIIALCVKSKTTAGQIFLKTFQATGTRAEKSEYVQSLIDWHTTGLQKRLTPLATIGSTAPYIGLFGTVLGVMRSFRDLATYSGAGPSVVAAGIAEALVNTAAGLFVAIPALYAYNYFITRSNHFAGEVNYISEEIIAHMARQRLNPPAPKSR